MPRPCVLRRSREGHRWLQGAVGGLRRAARSLRRPRLPQRARAGPGRSIGSGRGHELDLPQRQGLVVQVDACEAPRGRKASGRRGEGRVTPDEHRPAVGCRSGPGTELDREHLVDLVEPDTAVGPRPRADEVGHIERTVLGDDAAGEVDVRCRGDLPRTEQHGEDDERRDRPRRWPPPVRAHGQDPGSREGRPSRAAATSASRKPATATSRRTPIVTVRATGSTGP